MRSEPFDVRIDRTTKWGNPFRVGEHGNRPTVIEKFEQYARGRPDLISTLSELKGKRLGCHCKPLACHGDVLVRLVAEFCP